jgi:hypothetical protein
MLGVYPKVDSSHGFGFNSNTVETQIPMRCIGTSRKIQSIVAVPSECGLCTSPPSMVSTKFTIMLYRGIGSSWLTDAVVRFQKERRRGDVSHEGCSRQYNYRGVILSGLCWMGFHATRLLFYDMNIRLSAALSHPEDVRSIHMSTMNRKNRYIEHYIDWVGDKQHSMRVPLWYQTNC